MSKHTPGPWKATFKAGTYLIQSPEWRTIALAGYTDSEDDANARLIAAAPDLLEAIRSMVDMFERHIDGREGPDDAAARWDKARAAIAKAETA